MLINRITKILHFSAPITVFALSLCLCACSNNNNTADELTTTETTTMAATQTTAEETTTLATTQATAEEITTAQPNTTAKVDEIARQARTDAQSIDEAKTNEAISFIRDNYPDYFTDNETMENTMYYGYLLEYAYTDINETYANLGMDAYQAVKYVYRGVETVEDNATQENLMQISESLSAIN